MGCISRRVVAGLIGLAIGLALPASASASLTDQQRAERGAAYISTAQRPNGSIPAFSPIGSTSDAVLAFVATGVGRPQIRAALAYLRRQVIAGNVAGVGLKAKVVMAVSAAGRDPRDFGGTNLVASIRGQIDADGHIDDAAVFDQSLGLLALEAAGARPSKRVTGWLLDAQCPDGGWAYDAPYAPATDDEHCDDGTPTDFFTSDSNTTSYAVQGLASAGRGTFTDDPFAFFDSVRDPDHMGWAYSAGFIATDANSTGLVLQAYAAASETIPSGGLKALRRLQHPTCGAWAYTWSGNVKGDPDVGATIGAIPGLLRMPFPVSGPVSGGVPSLPAC
jgi:hypothetical protein